MTTHPVRRVKKRPNNLRNPSYDRILGTRSETVRNPKIRARNPKTTKYANSKPFYADSLGRETHFG